MGRWGLPLGSHCFSMFLILILSRWGDPSAKTCKTPTPWSSPMMELRNDKIVRSSLGLNLSISHCFFPYSVRRKPYPLDGFKRSDKLRKHQQTKATSVRSTPLLYSRLERFSLYCLCSMLPSSHSLAFNVWIAKYAFVPPARLTDTSGRLADVAQRWHWLYMQNENLKTGVAWRFLLYSSYCYWTSNYVWGGHTVRWGWSFTKREEWLGHQPGWPFNVQLGVATFNAQRPHGGHEEH